MTLFNTPGAEDKAAQYLSEVEAKYNRDGQLDVDALKKGKAESDWFIDRLQAEAAEARAELNKRMSYEEIMEKINSTRTISREDNPSLEQNDTPDDKSLDIEQIIAKASKQVRDGLTQEQQEAQARANVAKVAKDLEDIWGKNFSHKLKARIGELQLSEARATQLAAESPTAFLEMVSPQAKRVADHTPPSSSVRSTGNLGSTQNYAYYEKMRKNDPKSYWNPKTQNEIAATALAKGPDFYK